MTSDIRHTITDQRNGQVFSDADLLQAVDERNRWESGIRSIYFCSAGKALIRPHDPDIVISKLKMIAGQFVLWHVAADTVLNRDGAPRCDDSS